MKRFFNWVVRLFSYRRSWVRQITVAAVASATAWVIGDNHYLLFTIFPLA